LVRQRLEFLPTEDLVVAYRIKDNAGGDEWNDIVVICNANRHPITMNLPTEERYKAVVENGVVDYQALPEYQKTVTVAPQSATILKR
jgi:pullulanase